MQALRSVSIKNRKGLSKQSAKTCVFSQIIILKSTPIKIQYNTTSSPKTWFLWEWGTKRIGFHCKFVSSIFKLRSSRPEVFRKKDVPEKFAKFTGNHLCQSVLVNQAADLIPTTLLKKNLWRRCFPVNFAKFLSLFYRTPLVAASINCETWNICLNNN